jgi:hypothetical protein
LIAVVPSTTPRSLEASRKLLQWWLICGTWCVTSTCSSFPTYRQTDPPSLAWDINWTQLVVGYCHTSFSNQDIDRSCVVCLFISEQTN